MKCPYCTSEISDAALVCPHCTRELYLLRPLLEKISALELQLKDQPEIEALRARVHELENPAAVFSSANAPLPASPLADWATFWLAPLLLLLGAHVLITVVYDWHTLILRIASLLIPLPFAVLLMRSERSFWRWLLAAFALGLFAALGMSTVTGLVDHTAFMPQDSREWREFIDYAASIGFSGMTGMLVGDLGRRRHAAAEKEKMHQLTVRLVTLFSSGKQSAEKIYATVTRLREISSALTAVATTAVATYAGLKAIFGWG